jgi:aminopeptidase N
MIKGLRVLSSACLLMTSCGQPPDKDISVPVADELLLAPGVSRQLAEFRAATMSDLRYEISLSIPAAKDEPIPGVITARFDLSDHTRGVIFDFAQPADHVRSVSVDGVPTEFSIESEHIIIGPSSLSTGPTEITIDFVAGDSSLNRNEEFLYTLFVPARARVAIPIFDQPDLKARVLLRLDTPEDWQAVSNGTIDSQQAENGRLHLAFRETRPISTYLFAFAVGRFEIETVEVRGRTMRMFHRETDPERIARNLDTIFDLHFAALDWLETYTGIPYPFDKFDFAVIPAFQFGGMEHPGSIFYRDRSLFLDESATQRQVLGRATLIAHETAHMWFGDLVTMEWFDDVWMKEVFANFMAAKVVNPSFPEIDHDLAFLLDHYPSAYAVDRTAGANPIRQPLENLSDAGSLYGNIIYDKAPIVMKHLELFIGEDIFRSGLREYLEGHRYGNATWPDLIDVLDRLTSHDLESWSRVWVNEPGRPTVETVFEIEEERVGAMRVRQTDPADKDRLWVQPLNPLLVSPTSDEGVTGGTRIPIRLDQKETLVDPAIGLEPPLYVLANGAGIGYGYFKLTPCDSSALLARLPTIRDPMVRAIAWITLWDAMLEAVVSPEDFAELAIRALATETDEQNLQRVLRYLEGAYWKYLSDDQRQRLAPAIESLLFEQLHSTPSVTMKSAYFETFRSIVLTQAGVSMLRRLWTGELAIPGVPLSEDDMTSLAEELALRGVDDSAEILERQLEQIENPDRRQRFEFVRPALSNKTLVRDAFFERLEDAAAERKREPWVLEALEYLHHPLRAKQAEHYIRPSLEMIEEIQRTGDIFFPLGWLQATLSGHSSPQAASIIQDFLESRTDLPPRLRGKLLQASDPLFRAAEIKSSIAD